MSEEAPHATLENDAEMNVVRATTMGASEGRDLSRWDTPICQECRRGDSVTTTSRREGNLTVKRHTCTRCDQHGATVVLARYRDAAKMWTAGDVNTIDLELDHNADARGTC